LCGLLDIFDIELMLLLVGVAEEEVVPISAGGCVLGALTDVRLVEQEELPIPTSDCTLGVLVWWGICLIESDGYAIVRTQLCGEIVERGISLLGIGDRDSIAFSSMDGGGLEIASSTSITDVVENACSGCVASILSGEEGGGLRGCGCCAVFFA
jgi:hypothetical protein